jgi:hypothetical protein
VILPAAGDPLIRINCARNEVSLKILSCFRVWQTKNIHTPDMDVHVVVVEVVVVNEITWSGRSREGEEENEDKNEEKNEG